MPPTTSSGGTPPAHPEDQGITDAELNALGYYPSRTVPLTAIRTLERALLLTARKTTIARSVFFPSKVVNEVSSSPVDTFCIQSAYFTL